MEIKDFFDFMSQPLSSTIQAHPAGRNIDYLNLIKGNYQGIDLPISFKQKYGKKLCDVLDTGYPNLYLISERMRKVLEENNLTGWKVFPIKLYNKKGDEISGYHGFSAAGRCGPTSYEKSEIIEKRQVPNGPICQYYKGVFIDNWDGTDFFTPDGTYRILVTKKAVGVLTANKITNMYLRNLATIEISI